VNFPLPSLITMTRLHPYTLSPSKTHPLQFFTHVHTYTHSRISLSSLTLHKLHHTHKKKEGHSLMVDAHVVHLIAVALVGIFLVVVTAYHIYQTLVHVRFKTDEGENQIRMKEDTEILLNIRMSKHSKRLSGISATYFFSIRLD